MVFTNLIRNEILYIDKTYRRFEYKRVWQSVKHGYINFVSVILLLGTKCVFKHQHLKMFGPKQNKNN